MRNLPTKFSRKAIKSDSGEKGFTILELIIAMTIFMIVTGSIWGVLRVARAGRSVTNQQVQLAKNVRMALNVLGRDTYNAGYGYPLKNTVLLPNNRVSPLIGIPNDNDTTRDTLPPILAGNNLNIDNYNTTANTMTDQVTFLFKDSSFNPVPPTGTDSVSTPININAPTTTAGGIDEIVPTSGGNSACRVNDIYLITGATGSTLGVSTALNGSTAVQFSNGDVLGFNLSGPTGPLNTAISLPASMMRVKMVTYFVASDGTLTRREFVNAPVATPAVAYVDEPLVYNVDDFQIRYIKDDGTSSDNPSAGPDGIAGNADDTQNLLAAVRQVRFTVSVRSTELNSQGQPYRENMTATFSTRNLGYDAN